MSWKRRVKQLLMAVIIPVFLNVPLLLHIHAGLLINENGTVSGSGVWQLLWLVALFGSWLWVNIAPYQAQDQAGHVRVRLLAMRGGCTLCWYALWGFCFQMLFGLLAYPRLLSDSQSITAVVLAVNTGYAVMICFLMLWNGILRMFLLSSRLRVRTRFLMILAMWIPLLNLLVLIYAIRLVLAEYDFACYKDSVRRVRAESDLCRTRYPLIMVHGVGFRDLKYFNYWGRIPRELTRYGAAVYYGNQEAMGTIACNAEDIKKKILEVLAATGSEKVNIIAHSKGGLDARYAVSKLGMGPYVASLTTVCTPHRGCRFVDYACRLPERLYRFVARCFDGAFRRFGDRNPDFYTATRQFSTRDSERFNLDVTDVKGVYYQSYASMMRRAASDLLLWLPYCLIYPLEGPNDGLVSIESAKWGRFREVFKSSRMRGISHGDMIDLKREDYQGFDVVECFVQIVSDLREGGF